MMKICLRGEFKSNNMQIHMARIDKKLSILIIDKRNIFDDEEGWEKEYSFITLDGTSCSYTTDYGQKF